MIDIQAAYMRRALQIARGGLGNVAPNPMVGAVIVVDDKIVGEGYHRRWGEAHAEVNAVASVKDPALLRRATMYVTLEPCSHYGKTPPCAKLIIDSGIPRVVVGCMDPFEKVSGRGVAMLRDAGVEVATGVLEDECRELNRVFMTAHSKRRPFVTLKWAMSADGYMDCVRTPDQPSAKFSTGTTKTLVHLLRSRHEAIMVGSGTVIYDNPRLDVRGVAGRQPVKVVLDIAGRVSAEATVFASGRTLYFGLERRDLPAGVERMALDETPSVESILSRLYESGITSLLVEGGAETHRRFIESGLWDDCRVEISPVKLGESGRCKMNLPIGGIEFETEQDGNKIVLIRNISFQVC